MWRSFDLLQLQTDFWLGKTTLNYENEDGSLALLYDQAVVDNMEPGDMYKLISSQSKGSSAIWLGRRTPEQVQFSS